MDGTVLVADDDRTIRTVLTQALTRAGCKVHATSSLTTLMRWVAEGKGDAIITDVVMPGVDGPTLARSLRARRPDLRVIFISGYAEDRLRRDLDGERGEMQGPAPRFLAKPFSLKALASTVKDVIEG